MSLTISTEGTLLYTVIEEQEGQDITTCNIPNTFVQTHVEEKDNDGNQTIMKISGVCVDNLCKIDPIYQDIWYLNVTRKCCMYTSHELCIVC